MTFSKIYNYMLYKIKLTIFFFKAFLFVHWICLLQAKISADSVGDGSKFLILNNLYLSIYSFFTLFRINLMYLMMMILYRFYNHKHGKLHK